MKKLLILLCFACCTMIAKGEGYTNPVIPGYYPDPSVCRVGDDYYLVTSTFEFFPGVPIFHSKDMINWTQIGNVLTRPSQLPLDKCRPSGGIYAPTIRYHNGVFYMVTTNVTNGGNFYVTATDPRGEWSEPIYVKQPGIDPSLYFEGDKVYFASASQKIYLSEIDIKTGEFIVKPRVIWNGTGGRYPEAPHMYKKDGMYYLLIAEGGTEYGHAVTIARSNDPWGPYDLNPANPILTHSKLSGALNPIQGTGHADIVEAADGSWWMVCLAFRPMIKNHHMLGRETFLAPVRWDTNAWPVVNGNGTISLDMKCKTLPQQSAAIAMNDCEFDSPKMPLNWNYLRNPHAENYSLSEKSGYLRLTGSDISIDTDDSPTFVGRRQQHFNFEFTTCVEAKTPEKGDRIGMTVYMNPTSHYDLSVSNVNGRKELVLRCKLGLLDTKVAAIPMKSDKVFLKVTGSETSYAFSYSTDGTKFTELGKLDTRYLSTETAGGFTGVYVALFAEGRGAKGYFDWAKYTPIK